MKSIEVAVIGVGGYVALNALIFYPSVGGVDYFEVTGYLNGLVRGAGSKEAAQAKLSEWVSYWTDKNPWAGFIINYFKGYAEKRITAIYLS